MASRWELQAPQMTFIPAAERPTDMHGTTISQAHHARVSGETLPTCCHITHTTCRGHQPQKHSQAPPLTHPGDLCSKTTASGKQPRSC